MKHWIYITICLGFSIITSNTVAGAASKENNNTLIRPGLALSQKIFSTDNKTHGKHIRVAKNYRNYQSDNNTQFVSRWIKRIRAGKKYVFRHGLGQAPHHVTIQVRRKSTGDIIVISPQYAYGYSTYGGLKSVQLYEDRIVLRIAGETNFFGNDRQGGIKVADAEIRVIASTVSAKVRKRFRASRNNASRSEKGFVSRWTRRIRAGKKYVFRHGLGQAPHHITIQVRRKSTGDIIVISPQYAYGYSTYGGLKSLQLYRNKIVLQIAGETNFFGNDRQGGIKVADAEIRIIANVLEDY